MVGQPDRWSGSVWLVVGRAALLLVAGALLYGCAGPAASKAMIPSALSEMQRHAGTVSVKVMGGQETSAMWKPQISNEAFRQALVQAIEASHSFSKVIEGVEADYWLSVVLFSMEQPTIGGAFRVKLEAGWTLTRASGGAKVWQEAIKSEYTATMGDAFGAAKRLRLATEGAARENIAEGLAKIARLEL